MAFIRYCFAVVLLCFCLNITKAQTIYYPAYASQLLKSTAEDMAQLLQKAMPSGNFTIQQYSIMPQQGIVLAYDNTNTFTSNQQCAVKCNGTLLTFKAPLDNGLVFGVYQYLHQLGFTFYQPGSIWQITPSLTTAIKTMDTVYSGNYKYKSWFISGGYRAWAMDKLSTNTWDLYGGENGHEWALYQRRNSMFGEYNFTGHRADILTGDYLNTIKNNPCYVAEYNGKRTASAYSVPDINNDAAIKLWASTIEKKLGTNVNTTIAASTNQATINALRNANNKTIGIEVPDGSQWGNTNETNGCASTKNYPTESDQQFTLANATAAYISNLHANKNFQVYAYAAHANIPSANIDIRKDIDVQLIPSVYQTETTPKGLRNRWINKTKQLSEYHYLNLSAWSGELPFFKWNDLTQLLQTTKQNKTHGIVWEASPAKFGSLPYLLAANNFLQYNMPVDETLQNFCNDMFGNASKSIYDIFKMMGSDEQAPSLQKITYYIDALKQAEAEATTQNNTVKERLNEVKAYIHYMILYFENKAEKNAIAKAKSDDELCLYLARISKMQLVNSYYLINVIIRNYEAQSSIYIKYNTASGTAYNNGLLAPLSSLEINDNFKEDVATFSNKINKQNFVAEEEVAKQFAQNKISPQEKIETQLRYTNGLNYFSATAYNIVATQAGSFTVNYKASFETPKKGYVNFIVEAVDDNLNIIKDVVLNNSNTSGTITFNLPKAGKYHFAIYTKFKVVLDLSINTNKNYFYRKGAFATSKIELHATALNTQFYIPQNLQRVYFTINNYSNGKYIPASSFAQNIHLSCIDNAFNTFSVRPILVTPKDSSFYYFEVPNQATGKFWKIASNTSYSIQLVNTSNYFWFTKAGNNNVAEEVNATSAMFPNPSSAVFNCMLNGSLVNANQLLITNTNGNKVAEFTNVKSYNLGSLAAGIYLYKMQVNGVWYSGKVVKM